MKTIVILTSMLAGFLRVEKKSAVCCWEVKVLSRARNWWTPQETLEVVLIAGVLREYSTEQISTFRGTLRFSSCWELPPSSADADDETLTGPGNDGRFEGGGDGPDIGGDGYGA